MSVNSTMNAKASSFKIYSDSIHSEGKNIFDKISGAFTDLSNLNTNSGWKGTRYDDVVDAFNKMVADFNSMIKDVEETIPNSLQNAAKIIDSYSPDPAGFTATTYASSSISEISKSNTNSLVFAESQVLEARRTIKEKFNSALDSIDKVETTFNSMESQGVWSGDAFINWKGKIGKYKKATHTALDTLITDFAACMKQAKDDFETMQTNINKSLSVTSGE